MNALQNPVSCVMLCFCRDNVFDSDGRVLYWENQTWTVLIIVVGPYKKDVRAKW